LEVSGPRQGYRRVDDDPEVDSPASEMSGQFSDREGRDVDRVQQVLEFAGAADCSTRRLLAHFGEELGQGYGHCGRCPGRAPRVTPPIASRGPGRTGDGGPAADERPASLATSRQLARFLCGLSCPATTHARLATHPLFGTLADVPFAQVLSLAEGRGVRNLDPAR
jgi:ATP-dependent DNA helicase RecQ